MKSDGIGIDLPERYASTGVSEGGGSGDVVFCMDTNLERQVAIKIVRDPENFDRMKDEIQGLLSMRSRYVVQVYDIIEFHDGQKGIVLEFVNGDNLFESTNHKSSEIEYLKTIWQIAAGIEDIHKKGIIHRDIKPNNMKLDPEGIIKIFDFGLSREEDIDAHTTGFRGTFGFAAPELFVDGKVNFTKAVDVYAFGATALYLANDDLPKEIKKAGKPDQINPDEFIFLDKNYPGISNLLISCFDHDPSSRPEIETIKNLIEKYLVKGKHQALAVMNGYEHILNSKRSRVSVKAPGVASFNIEYDDLNFFIDNIVGDIYINNLHLTDRSQLNGSCVITMGAPQLRMSRSYVTFDISNPEVAI